MKPVRLLLIAAAFLIMIAAGVNYMMIIGNGEGKLGVILELIAMALIASAVGLLGYKEKRKNR